LYRVLVPQYPKALIRVAFREIYITIFAIIMHHSRCIGWIEDEFVIITASTPDIDPFKIVPPPV